MATKKTSGSKKGSRKAAPRATAVQPRRAPRRALCVGINDYPYDGNDLNGCVNDSRAWAELLVSKYGFAGSDVRVMNDAEATRAGVLAALRGLVAGARSGDVIVFT